MLATAHDLPQPSPARASARGRVRAAVAYVRERPTLRALMLVQASGILFFTISVPVEVVFVRTFAGREPGRIRRIGVGVGGGGDGRRRDLRPL